MNSKVKMARICILIEAWLGIISSVIVLAMTFLGVGVLNSYDSQIGGLAFGAFMGIFGLVGLALSILAFFVAKGIRDKANWARIVGIILGILNLTGFPIGTLLGVLILIGLLGEDASEWFGRVPQQEG